jgi:hypothetical protein
LIPPPPICKLKKTAEDQKTAVRDCFNDFQPSTWKLSRRIRRKIRINAENGGEHTDNF